MHESNYLSPTLYQQVGTIHKVRHVQQGIIALNLHYQAASFPSISRLFVRQGACHIPYHVVDWQDKGHAATCTLPDLVQFFDMEQGAGGREVYLTAYEVEGMVTKNTPSSHWIGYTVYDKVLGHLGEVSAVYERVSQPLLGIAYAGREVLIPYHTHFVAKVDVAAQRIELTLPSGYLEAM
jgi:hypothetical protein